MDREKPTGFTLFPQPPTPPAKKSRIRAKSTSSSVSSKLVKNKSPAGRGHSRKSSTSVSDQANQPGLIPAPLHIRKACEDIPPIPTWLPSSVSSSVPTKTKTEFTTPPKTPDSAPPQLPAIPQSSPFTPLPRTPLRHEHTRTRSKLKAIAEFVELEAEYSAPVIRRLSQWLDLEDGGVDRRRLSMYLGSVLDNTFEVPTFESGSGGSVSLSRRVSRIELQSLIEQCQCPPDTILCHCVSSPEFERFRSWSHHKQNASVSSTACLLGVPRARFQSAFFHVREPSIAELPGTPGLLDDDDYASEGDWASPKTPSRDDVFHTPSGRKKKPTHGIFASPPSSTSSTPSKLHSFSRPFRPDSTYRSTSSEGSTPSTPSRTRSRSKHPKSGFLTSISTVSSFDFEFDFKSRRESLLQQRQELSEFQFMPSLSNERDQSNHLRTESGESFCSQASHYELSTATATVAMSSAAVKPVLITNLPKRTKTPSATSGSNASSSISSSTKSSTSSFSVPEYWRQFDAGMRARSRSTTMTSTVTNESAAFSAMLTAPLLSPKGVPHRESMPGNAFAQRSNTTRSMPLSTPSSDFSQFDFGVNNEPDSKNEPAQPDSPEIGRAATVSTVASKPDSNGQQALPSSGDMSRSVTSSTVASKPGHSLQNSPELGRSSMKSQFDSSIPSPVVDNHMQAHFNANAKLKAFFESSVAHNPPAPKPSQDRPTGLGLISSIAANTPASSLSRKKKKSYTSTDDQDLNRNDSGVFGRISAHFGGMPGRREFSQPQFYREEGGGQ